MNYWCLHSTYFSSLIKSHPCLSKEKITQRQNFSLFLDISPTAWPIEYSGPRISLHSSAGTCG
jgi:hypothetical protein